MKEYKVNSGYGWHAWFWVDKQEFAGDWGNGKLRYHIERAVGRADDGKLFLMVWTNLDQYDSSKFSKVFYEIDENEYIDLLDSAIKQGEVKPIDREHLINRMKAPFTAPWDREKDIVVYRDLHYTLGQKDYHPYLIVDGKRLTLKCEPHEPCMYIIDEDGHKTTVHYSFDPFDALAAFNKGETITSITGREYDAKDFCKMVEYVSGMSDIDMNEVA